MCSTGAQYYRQRTKRTSRPNPPNFREWTTILNTPSGTSVNQNDQGAICYRNTTNLYTTKINTNLHKDHHHNHNLTAWGASVAARPVWEAVWLQTAGSRLSSARCPCWLVSGVNRFLFCYFVMSSLVIDNQLCMLLRLILILAPGHVK